MYEHVKLNCKAKFLITVEISTKNVDMEALNEPGGQVCALQAADVAYT